MYLSEIGFKQIFQHIFKIMEAIMATKAYYPISEIAKGKTGFTSSTRAIIEAAFYGNNVVKVTSLREAYKLAANSPGTIVTDMPIYEPERLGLDQGSKVLLFNDGGITGRFAAARRIVGKPGVNQGELNKIIMDGIYDTRYKKMYHAEAFIGLDPEFMVKAHLLIPEGEENILYNWMLNFQYESDKYEEMYKNSKLYDEPDIYIFSDPQWKGAPNQSFCLESCLSYFHTEANCACILGMRYFGEHKKGTLTLAWAMANRNGYASCHGGQKEFTKADGSRFVAGVFGLSGSGKSTITHATHNNKFKSIKVLHDDAFVINAETCSSVALEPSYFDKTNDYPTGCKDNKYLLTVQNCSATMDEFGKVQIVTEDLRNGNGRAIKSKIWSPNRVDKFDSPIKAIFWIMKDLTLPPVVKLKGASLAAVMGATLATKRTNAERLAKGVDPNALVVEPYANPFRTYPLANDYSKFKDLVEKKNVDCYIINTGDFMGKKINKEVTLGLIEDIVEEKATFKQWGPFSDIEIYEIEGFVPNLKDAEYVKAMKARMQDRLNYVTNLETKDEGYDKLPQDAAEAIKHVVEQSETL